MLDKAKFVLSRKKLQEQINSLQGYADKISYSVKTNYEIGKLLSKISGCDFSVHSVESARFINKPEKTWFFAQAWSPEEIEILKDMGINSFVVDNKNDLDILLENAPEKFNLLLRMRLKEYTLQTGKHFVYGFFSPEINKLLPELRKNKNIESLGVHFHRKTQNISEWSLKRELENSISDSVMKQINVINIGGGIPSIYKNYREGISEKILEKIKQLKNWLNQQQIQMIMEPGRYIAAPPVKLVARIKNIYADNIIINCSVYNSAMDTFIANVRLLVEEEVPDGKAYTIKGCTPDSLDIFRYKVLLKDPKVGDTITLLNAGAYNFTTDFCMLPKLETEITE